MAETSTQGYSLSMVSKYLQVIILTSLLLYFGKALFIPLCFGLLIAVITYPACKWLESKKWHRTIAVTVLILAVALPFVVLVWLLVYEVNLFLSDIPLIKQKIFVFWVEMSKWLESVGIHQATQDSMLANALLSLEQSMTSIFRGALSLTASTMVSMILVPIYAALFLYHRGTFVRFLESVAGAAFKGKLNTILQQSIITYFKFIKGTFFVYCIVGALNSAGLLMLGIKHAVLFGVVTAFMTAIPYVGIIISAALPVSVALITKDSAWYAVGVVAVFTVIQYLEANVIFPRIVGEQLNLSTWAVLVSIMAGTILWGISGMILFIPFAAILKIISDNIEEWKPVNILLNREAGYKG